jgi:hypothetical protein
MNSRSRGGGPGDLRIPRSTRTSLVYVDESGSKATASRFFVVAAAKLREPGRFHRALRDIRDKTGFQSEMKFADINRGSLSTYYAMIDEIEASDLHLAACVVNKDTFDPFRAASTPVWKVHADVTVQLLVGCINRGEVVTVMGADAAQLLSVGRLERGPIGLDLGEGLRSRVSRTRGRSDLMLRTRCRVSRAIVSSLVTAPRTASGSACKANRSDTPLLDDQYVLPGSARRRRARPACLRCASAQFRFVPRRRRCPGSDRTAFITPR